MKGKTKVELIHDIENLSEECDQLKAKIFQLETAAASIVTKLRDSNSKVVELEDNALVDFCTIDFGVGLLYYKVHRGSVISLNEFMQAVNDAALVVPLPSLIKSIKSNTLSLRF